MNYPFRIIWRSLASNCILDFILFSEFVDIFATERHRKSKEQLKMNLIQLKLDWVSLPNLRNRSYLGESRKSFWQKCWLKTFFSVIPSTTDDYFLFSSSQNNEQSVLKRYLRNVDKKNKKFLNGKTSKETGFQGTSKNKSPKMFRKQMHIYMPSAMENIVDVEAKTKWIIYIT